MTAYYNEIDPYAAQWLRNLIDAGLIAPGDVDERDIRDVVPNDLRRYTQCHFFAGIGVWSGALRQAGWTDERPVWTGSCPCQPFSASGKGEGFADERHLWPAWHHLIRGCSPPIIFGEQVASPNGYTWLDLVQADLEATAYTCGPIVLPAAGFGAPHGRHRIFYMAHPAGRGQRELGRAAWPGRERYVDGGAEAGELADADGRDAGAEREQRSRQQRQFQDDGSSCPVADAAGGQLPQPLGGPEGRDGAGSTRKNDPDAAVNGFWFDSDWIWCRDEKWRAVEPSTFPLVDGASFGLGSGGPFEGKSRTAMLRGYGNAIVKEVAAEFIAAAREAIER